MFSVGDYVRDTSDQTLGTISTLTEARGHTYAVAYWRRPDTHYPAGYGNVPTSQLSLATPFKVGDPIFVKQIKKWGRVPSVHDGSKVKVLKEHGPPSKEAPRAPINSPQLTHSLRQRELFSLVSYHEQQTIEDR